MADYVVAQAAVLIVPTTEGFRKRLEAQLKKIQMEMNGVEIEARLDSKKMIAEGLAAKKYLEKDPVNVKFRVVDATKQITEIRHKYEDVVRQVKKGLILNLKIVGMSLLPQLAQGLAAVNASMVELTRTAVALPGILAGALSSFATLATGLSGVKAAFKEYKDAQKNAAQEGLKARNSAINVQNAYRDLGRSIKDAKRNLEDLNAELRNAPLDEADAIIAVAEARAEAADKAGKSGLQQQKDTLALMKAENALVDVRLRNSRLVQDVAEANAKGVAGADSVREATERLSKAQDEANTQATKLTDSLKELSPNAQKAAEAFANLDSKWQILKNATQDRLFVGLDAEITRLGQVSLPTLQRGFGAIADSLNGNVKAAFKSIESETNQGFLDKIFGDTATAQANLSKAFDPFIDSLLRLSATGTDFLPRLVDGLVDLTTRFDNFIVRAEGDGSLEKWINQGIDEFNALGNSIMNLGSMLNSLSEAFTGSGGKTFLQVLEDGTKRLADLLKSTEGQKTLREFFTGAREEFARWSPLLDQLPGLLSNVAKAGQQWADFLIPKLTSMASLLAAHPGLVSALFKMYVGWKTIVPTIKGVKSAIEGLGKVTEFINQNVFAGAQGHIGKYATAMGTAKTKIANLTSAIAGPAGLTAMAGALATFLTYNLVDAHDQAAAAARRQQTDLDNLTASLTSVTGAATAATNALVAKNFREGENAGTGKIAGDVLSPVISDPRQQTDLIQKVASGDLPGALAMVPGAADAKTIESTDFWDSYKENLQGAGISADMVAKAVNGDPAAKAKFDEWIVGERRRKASNVLPFSGRMSPEFLAGLEKSTVIAETPDLLDIQSSLPQNMQQRSRLQNEIYANTSQIQQGSTNIRTDNQRAQGAVKLPDGSPFESLGVIVPPGLGQNREGELVTSSAPPDGSPLAERLRNDGVTFRMDGPGRYIVSLTPEAAAKYFVPFASGGLISGPGSGTSDSILARLSRGEYVVNADSTQKHLPLLESINRGGVPGLAGGGLLGDAFAAPKQPDPPRPVVPPGPISDWLFQLPAPPQPSGPLIGSAGAATPGTEPSSGLGSLLGADSSLELSSNPYQAPGRNYDAITGSTLASVFSPKPILDAANAKNPVSPVPAPPKPVSSSAATSVQSPVSTDGGTIGTSTDSRVNPNTAVHRGSGQLGPGGQQSTPGFPTSAGLPSVIPPSGGFVPGGALLPQGSAAGSEAGLRSSTTRGRRALLAAFPFLEEVGGYRQDPLKWHPNGQALDAMIPASMRFTGQGYALGDQITQWAMQNASGLGIEHVIWNKKIYYPDGRVSDMQATGNKTQDHEDHPHIVFSESPYPTADSRYFAPAGGIVPFSLDSQGFASPSNIPFAMTPTGVPLPQLSYATGVGGSLDQGGIRLPTPEEYAKYVTESWAETLQNLVKNSGAIAMNLIGSFFGLDFSPITGVANSIIGGIDLPGMGGSKGDGKGGDAASRMGALPDVASIIEASKQLPPGYQQAFLEAALQNPEQAGELLQQFMGSGVSPSVQFDPKQGAEQWRPLVRQVLSTYGPRYGIANLQAWEDAIVRQIQTESSGNPAADNPKDSDGQGGTQRVQGLLQFLPETFSANNISGGNYLDPAAQIAAVIPYVLGKYGMDDSGAPKHIGRGVGYASGGRITGPGGATSDSIIARVSNGEYIVRAPMAQKHLGLLNAINANKLPGFAEGTPPNLYPVPVPPPQQPPPPVTTPDPPVAPVPPDPGGPVADVNAGMPTAPAPVTDNQGPGDAESVAMQEVGAVLGGIGESITSVSDGAQAPAGGNPEGDPRSLLGAAPQNLDHNKPALSAAIQGTGAAISGWVNTAIQAASIAGTAAAGAGAAAGGAPGAGAAAGPAISGLSGSASGIISGLISAATNAVASAANVLSSAGVGTLTPGTTATAGAYGAPLTPQSMNQESYKGPQVINNWNGGVHTSNNEEFYKLQQRRELQNASSYLPQQ